MTTFSQRYLELPDVLYTHAQPTEVNNPILVLYNEVLAQNIGLDIKDKVNVLSGKHKLPGSEPLALAYAGHQYGRYTMLGDGRAHLLASFATNPTIDLQLKGSGPTVYSRGGDGLAALQPMLREYVISEAMHALGVATTRSLAVIKTDTPIVRDADDHAAILARIAKSHIRFGTFEYASHQDDSTHLEKLLDYVIKHHYPALTTAPNKAQALLQCVSDKLVDLIVAWMRVGFIHGVMNTDNMSIVAETIDYGPCAFMDSYHPATVFSYIDKYGRYAFANQPVIAQWNLTCLANTMIDLIDSDKELARGKIKALSERFRINFIKKYRHMLCNKIGFAEDTAIAWEHISRLLTWMQDHQADYTYTFKMLTYEEDIKQHPQYNKALASWFKSWQQAITNDTAAIALMQRTNPAVIPRNHLVHQALQACTQGDYRPIQKLIEAVTSPYSDTNEAYQRPPAEYERIRFTYCGT